MIVQLTRRVFLARSSEGEQIAVVEGLPDDTGYVSWSTFPGSAEGIQQAINHGARLDRINESVKTK